MFKFLGGMLLIIGSIIGGGILAIPIVSAEFGYLTTCFIIIATWIIMTKTGLYVLSLSLSCPEKYNSYYSIVGKFLGDNVKVLTVILYLWLLYFSLSSCISGCSSLVMSYLVSHHVMLSYFEASILFVLLFGGFIIISSKVIVRANALVVLVKLTLLVVAMGAASAHYSSVLIEAHTLFQKGGLSFTVILINAFGFQFIIPSLISYYGHHYQRQFKWIIVVSTTTVLCLYLAWLYTIYAIIPMQGEHGLLAIYHSSNQLIALNSSLFLYLHSTTMASLLTVFEMVALLGSFFCLSFGVFDFLLDLFKTDNRILVGLVTFFPPLLLTFFSENMYVIALSAAGYIAIILEIIIPLFAINRQYRRASV